MTTKKETEQQAMATQQQQQAVLNEINRLKAEIYDRSKEYESQVRGLVQRLGEIGRIVGLEGEPNIGEVIEAVKALKVDADKANEKPEPVGKGKKSK